jgi:uridine kinase
MAGVPSSGKSLFVKKFVETANDRKIIVVDPKEYLPDDLEDMDKEMQLEYRVAAWEVCLDRVMKTFHEPNETIIIFDTAGASGQDMIPLFTTASINNHYTVYVYVSSNAKECAKRAGDSWIGQEALDGYIKKYKKSIPELSSASNEHMVIKNIGEDGLKNIEVAATKLESIATRRA